MVHEPGRWAWRPSFPLAHVAAGRTYRHIMPTTLAQAIRNAIDAELAAARFYSLLADSTQDAAAKGFLEEMAELEREHAREIEKVGTELFDTAPADRADMDVSMVETLPDWKFVDGMTLGDAYQVALAAEQKAALYYDGLADYCEEPARDFFVSLSAQEEQHARLLTERFGAL